jgi:hypothetical protein
MVLFSVIDDSKLELPIEVPATQAAALREGAPVLLRTDERPPRMARGTVARVSPSISTANRTVGAWIVMPREESGFTPGSFLKASVDGRLFEDVYAIPRESIVDGGIFLAEKGRAKRLTPEFFAFLDDFALTREDLGGDVTLVTSGFERLYDGAPLISDEVEAQESLEDDMGEEKLMSQEAGSAGEVAAR